MKQEEVHKLIQLRNILITGYNKLDRNANPGSAVMLQKEVAALIERSMQCLDGVLSEHVNFENKT